VFVVPSLPPSLLSFLLLADSYVVISPPPLPPSLPPSLPSQQSSTSASLIFAWAFFLTLSKPTRNSTPSFLAALKCFTSWDMSQRHKDSSPKPLNGFRSCSWG